MSEVVHLNHLTKIEGHATLTLSVENGIVEKCELSSVEGSRYFEGILKGHYYDEAFEISSRICGVCSCAHTVAALMAVENALGVEPSRQTELLRKLLTIGERIRSHATHLYLLALPDYLGYESALAMLPKHRERVKAALRLIKSGNTIVKVVGGRDLHPVSATVGGFLKTPSRAQFEELAEELEEIRDEAIATAELFAGLKYPNFKRPTQYFSLYNGVDYPIFKGRFKAGDASFDQKDFHKYISEYHEPYSTANFVVKEGKAYVVGALARMNNNHAFLRPSAKKIAAKATIKFPSTNPFANNIAQALEILHYVERAIEICNELRDARAEAPMKIKPRAGTGISAVEVPRGTLWHEYELNEKGRIVYANIVTPTAQNLRNMQDDIRAFLPSLLHKPNDELVNEIEKLIRAYDPCFSCSTHFLKVNWLKRT